MALRSLPKILFGILTCAPPLACAQINDLDCSELPIIEHTLDSQLYSLIRLRSGLTAHDLIGGVNPVIAANALFDTDRKLLFQDSPAESCLEVDLRRGGSDHFSYCSPHKYPDQRFFNLVYGVDAISKYCAEKIRFCTDQEFAAIADKASEHFYALKQAVYPDGSASTPYSDALATLVSSEWTIELARTPQVSVYDEPFLGVAIRNLEIKQETETAFTMRYLVPHNMLAPGTDIERFQRQQSYAAYAANCPTAFEGPRKYMERKRSN